MLFWKSRLGRRFILLLLIVFAVGSTGAGLVMSRVVENTTERMFETQGLIVLQTMNSVRSYTTHHVGPLLASQQQTSEDFIKESVPAFSAKTVFETFRAQPDYQGFIYKEAALNPSNPNNLADDFETGLLRRFMDQPGDGQVTGFTQRDGQGMFYIARPMMMPDDSCLGCHGLPENAPGALLAEYGTINGFSWPRNGVVAAQVVYVPADLVFQQRRQVWLVVMGVLASASAASALVISFLLRRNVIRPVERMAQLASSIAAADVQATAADKLAPDVQRSDELGQLARVFQKMAVEVYAREQRLKQQVQELRISIDEARRARQVAEITDTEYFQQLQRRAKSLRQRGPDGKGNGADAP